MHQVNNRGITIVSVLAASAIASIVVLALFSAVKFSTRQIQRGQGNLQLEQLRQTILTLVDCQATFGATDPNGANCNSTSDLNGQDSAGTFLRLRRKTLDGSTQFLTGPLSGNAGPLFGWDIRTTCSASEQSLVVRAAKVRGAGFAKLPDGALANWEHPQSLLFGGSDQVLPLCYGSGTGGLLKRIAIFRANFTIQNDGTEFVEVDLTGSTPSLTGSDSGSITNIYLSEPFDTTGQMSAVVNLNNVDVRVKYYNVTATNPATWSFPSPGTIRIRLSARGDVGDYGASPPGVYGSARYTVLVMQQ